MRTLAMPKKAVAPTSGKTRLTARELTEFSEMLLAKRRELVDDVVQIEAVAVGGTVEGSRETLMPIHPADLGSDAWEQAFSLGLLDNKRGLLREIDEALARISERTYGICTATGRPISKARLRALPWTRYCIDYARRLEEGLA